MCAAGGSVARLTLIMPTVSGSGGEEVESQDEVKVFKYEGDEEESEKRSSENLTEDKSSLIIETEEVCSVLVFSPMFIHLLQPHNAHPSACHGPAGWRCVGAGCVGAGCPLMRRRRRGGAARALGAAAESAPSRILKIWKEYIFLCPRYLRNTEYSHLWIYFNYKHQGIP